LPSTEELPALLRFIRIFLPTFFCVKFSNRDIHRQGQKNKQLLVSNELFRALHLRIFPKSNPPLPAALSFLQPEKHCHTAGGIYLGIYF
jgi:hypothetical protein